jgi:hypothetical protein
MAQPKITPDLYDLKGQGVTINYSTSSISGKPQLTLKKGRQSQIFSGDEIGVLETAIGTLITVTIAKTVDRGFTTFSFLLPAIELASTAAKQTFKTIGVTTVHKTSIAGPVTGVQETYRTIALSGTAKVVLFLTQKTAGAQS